MIRVAVHQGCTASNPQSGACNAAIHRGCVAAGYLSGFGPLEYSGTEAYVTCLER